MTEMNGKETPYASFNKWTASRFLKTLRAQENANLRKFKEVSAERNHRFWQEKLLAITVSSKEIADQKLDYIHLNPLQEKWSLVEYPKDYHWSSANFYEKGN